MYYWIFGLLFLVVSFSCFSQVPQDYTQAFIEASALEQQKEFVKAVEILKKLELKYSQDYTLYLQMGWLYFQAGMYQEAKEKYQKAIFWANEAEAANLGFAWSCYYLKEYDNAIMYFEKVLKNYPENASAKEGLSYSYTAQYKDTLAKAVEWEKGNRPLEAAESLEKLRVLYPKDYTVQLRSAWLYFLAGNYILSEKHYRIALEIAPKDPDATIGLGWSLLYSGKYEEADQLFTEFLKQYPQNQSAQEGYYRCRSVLYEKQGNLEKAAGNLAPVAKKYPKDEKLVLYYAWLSFQAKSYADAQAAYESVLFNNPESIEAKAGLAWCLYYQKQWEESEKYFHSVLEKVQEHESAKQGLKAVQLAKAPAPRNMNLSASLSVTAIDYDSDHRIKEDGLAVSGNISLTLFQNFTSSLTLRNVDFSNKDDLAPIEDFDTNEVYFSSGLNFASFGIILHYAKAKDGSDAGLKIVKAYGLTLRWSDFFGDLSFEPSFSDYEYTSDVQRYALNLFTAEIIPHVHLQLGASYQRTDHQNYYNGSLAFYFYTGENINNAKWLFWIGGKYGDEFKPSYMAAHSIFNIIEEIQYGVNAGVQYSFDFGLKAFVAFDYFSLDIDDTRPVIQEINGKKQIVKAPFDFNSHTFAFTVGISYNFF